MIGKGPIVIGGIGGSGTRIIAQILKENNIFIGHDLNNSLDNLSYTLLFKRKKWFYKNQLNKAEIFKGLKILEKTMLLQKPKLTLSEKIFLSKSKLSMYVYGHNFHKDGKGRWAIERYEKLLDGFAYDDKQYDGWGWKEPNSHLILPYLNNYFPKLKYIHVIRSGLDMAYSPNQQQLFNWGGVYGVNLPLNKCDIPEASFRYWVEANLKAKSIGEKIGSDKFLLLNLESLCLNTMHEINRILNFINLYPNKSNETIVKQIKLPLTHDRHKKYEKPWLNENDLISLSELGY